MSVPKQVDASGRLRVPERWHGPLSAGLALCGIAMLALFVGIWQASSGWGYDFRAYYSAAERLITSGTPYQEATLGGPFRPGPGGLYLYSPLLAVLLQPLTALPFADATWLWLGLRLALLVAACALMPVALPVRLAALGLAGLITPTLDDLNLGNVSLIVTALSVVAWRSLDRPVGAMAAAAAVLLRPTMGLLLLWWAIRGRLPSLSVAIISLVGLGALTLPFVGTGGWLDYLTVLRNTSDVTGVYRNFDIGSLALNLGASPVVAGAAIALAGGLAITAVLVSLRRDRELSFVVVIGASLVLSPLLWNHYLTQLLIPAAFLASRGRWWGLALPMLTWLPHELLGLVALLATVAPLAAPDRGLPALVRPAWLRRQPAAGAG
ncbi:hypothetical protein BH23CHL7_BH23CHL7_02310 [soil metagenome]